MKKALRPKPVGTKGNPPAVPPVFVSDTRLNFPITAEQPSPLSVYRVFQLGIPYVLFSYAARVCPPLAISLIGMLEPIFSPIWVAIFVGEIPGPLALAGLFCAIFPFFAFKTDCI